jgi:uncharacterized membrane protein
MSEFTTLVFAALVAGWIICSFIALGGAIYRFIRRTPTPEAFLRLSPEERFWHFTLDLISIIFGPLWIGVMLAATLDQWYVDEAYAGPQETTKRRGL